MANFVLYGDGIHDDYPAIQEMLDSGVCEVKLPAPKVRYMISKTLVIPAFCKLKLPRFAEIRLMDGANCHMLMNRTVSSPAKRWEGRLFGFLNLYSPEPEDACCNFEIEGGIWNFNNLNQRGNPLYTEDFGPDGEYTGFGMLFYNVRNFRLSNLTLKDPVNFAVTIDRGSWFTIENITFDFNYGNPYAVNMDGIHLNGNCHHGVIRNLQGACYDDLVALNAHEGSRGDITDLEIDGIFAEGCHSAVRLLTVSTDIRNIRISNVYGTYYQYCIGITKFYEGETTGCFDSILLENICASKAKRLPVQEANLIKGGFIDYHFPLIWVQDETHVKHLAIRGLHRREFNNPIGTLVVDKTALVENLSLENLSLENHLEKHCPLVEINGRVKKLIAINVPEDAFEGSGVVEEMKTV